MPPAVLMRRGRTGMRRGGSRRDRGWVGLCHCHGQPMFRVAVLLLLCAFLAAISACQPPICRAVFSMSLKRSAVRCLAHILFQGFVVGYEMLWGMRG